jgi:hypothetical protein
VRNGTSPQSLTAIASLIDATVIGAASKGERRHSSGTWRIRDIIRQSILQLQALGAGHGRAQEP